MIERSSREYVGAAVVAYYCLLHLAICLMHLFPHRIEGKLLAKLREERKGGAEDPSKIISHEYAIKFIESCVRDGLDGSLAKRVRDAKALREFVNYGPRIENQDGGVFFGPCNRSSSESSAMVDQLGCSIESAVAWAQDNRHPDADLCRSVLSQCPDFFSKNELFYIRWCSEETIANARGFTAHLIAKASEAQDTT